MKQQNAKGGKMKKSKKQTAALKTSEYNIQDHIKYELQTDKSSDLHGYAYSVAQELLKTKIKTGLEVRPHKFTNGKGHVAKKLVIEIDFGDAVVQPHTTFGDDFAHACVKAMQENIVGLFENAGQ